jgi:hypothetical protein
LEVLHHRKTDTTKLREISNKDIPKTSEENYIAHVTKVEHQVRRVVLEEIPGMAFMMTNNDELGRLEEQQSALPPKKTKSVKSVSTTKNFESK